MFGGLLGRLGRRRISSKRWFTGIYERNGFRGTVSRSGSGSNLIQTETIRREIPKLIRELGVRVLLDCPCGDFFWMKEVDLDIERYIGVDIVEEIIAANIVLFKNEKREFLVADLIKSPLPKADLILCRDCLVHLTFAQAVDAILNFKRSNAEFLLATTFTGRDKNCDLRGREVWRPLNLQARPFGFPMPIRLINENCSEGSGQFGDKCLGLWRLRDV